MTKRRLFDGLVFWGTCLVSTCIGLLAKAQEPEYSITITSRYDVQMRQPKTIREFLRRHPNVRLKQWDGISITGGFFTASLAMAMAGNVGPDIFETDIRQAVSQGLALPLTEWIGQDGILANGQPKLKPDGQPDLNGRIDDDEAKWPGWTKLNPLLRQVVTVDGTPYALPIGWHATYVGILYSKYLVRRAGLDPMKPPRTWEDFIRWCRLLYDRKENVPLVEVNPYSWSFAPWVATTGSSIIVQDRKSPTTGQLYTFNEQVTDFHAPDSGEDLLNAVPKWRTNVASPECVAAVGFYHRLKWAPWISDPATGEPLELSPQDRTNGYVMFRGRRVAFVPEDIIEGCAAVTTLGISDTIRRLGRSVALYPLWSNDMTEFQNQGVEPSDMGMLPFPAMAEAQKPVLQSSYSFFMMGKDAAQRGGPAPQDRAAYRQLVWELMTLITGREGNDEIVRQKVASGQAKFLNPRDLKRLGFDDYLQEMPPENRLLWDQVESGAILEVLEPFMGKWLQFRDFYEREAIDLVLRPSGKDFDYAAALQRLEQEANSGLMFSRPEAELEAYRPMARVVAAVVAVVMAVFTALLFRTRNRRTSSTAGVYTQWLPRSLLLPALASIALWGYYPLVRGLIMAFQDYRIAGDSPFVGLNNFIRIALDPNFYSYLYATSRFVLWNLALTFFAPIVLALLLSEIPRLKVFFRTLYFLPQMTSGLVVALMWKEMYAPTASGTLNKLLKAVLGNGFQPIDWLGDPSTVMACVILPSVWAGAGISSLIYLAALKSVPDELYEAAVVDGAGIFRRIWSISLPTIGPLILITFIGAFIATFQSMGNIFLLTFGGPGKETMVMGMAIWREAYVNLNFSMATSYAWILGSILMAFTYLQLRILRRIDFRQAKGA